MQSLSRRLVVLGTGGTIAGSAGDPADHVGYTAAQLGVTELLADIPGFDRSGLEVEQVAQIDSKDMDHATLQRLALRVRHHLARADVGAVLITHGTDTLEETAWFLDRVVATDRPVVLTAAMRPATALHSDGPQNLLDAACVARWPGMGGVVAVVAGQVFAGRDLRKLHPYRLDAFGAGDGGALASVEQGRVRVFRGWPLASAQPGAPRGAALQADPASWPWVEIVTSHAGADRRGVDALVSAGVDGIVVAATGNGTLHRALEEGLRRPQRPGWRWCGARAVRLVRWSVRDRISCSTRRLRPSCCQWQEPVR